MDTDSSSAENTPQETAKTGRPPPMILTFTVNLIPYYQKWNEDHYKRHG
jgi:hypothetical protein